MPNPMLNPAEIAQDLWNDWEESEPCPLIELIDNWKRGAFKADARFVLEIVGSFYELQRTELCAIADEIAAQRA